MWHDHPISQRNRTTERTVGVGVGSDRDIGDGGGAWRKFEKGGGVGNKGGLVPSTNYQRLLKFPLLYLTS